MTRGVPRSAALLVLLAVSTAACGRGDDATVETFPATESATQAVRVSDVRLGNTIGPDRRVTAERNDFRPTDTIYASVITEGTGTSSSLTARWTYQDGQVLDETTQTLSPRGQAVTEFHISMPQGFPPGNYRVEILLDGQSVETEQFEVR
jgi:hypothetical protein